MAENFPPQDFWNMFSGIFHFFLFPLSILKRWPHSLQNQLLELAASVSAAADKVRLHLRCMGNGGRDRILRQKRENSRRNNPTLPRGPDKYLHSFSDWSWDPSGGDTDAAHVSLPFHTLHQKYFCPRHMTSHLAGDVSASRWGSFSHIPAALVADGKVDALIVQTACIEPPSPSFPKPPS